MRKIVICESCDSVMRTFKAGLERKEKTEKRLGTYLDINREQKNLEFLLEVWKCSCPRQVRIIYLLE